jgi:hypothetical protein
MALQSIRPSSLTRPGPFGVSIQRRFGERKLRGSSRNATRSRSFVVMSQLRNGNGHYPYQTNSV